MRFVSDRYGGTARTSVSAAPLAALARNKSSPSTNHTVRDVCALIVESYRRELRRSINLLVHQTHGVVTIVPLLHLLDRPWSADAVTLSVIDTHSLHYLQYRLILNEFGDSLLAHHLADRVD